MAGRLVMNDYCTGKPSEQLDPTFRAYLEEWYYFPIQQEEQHKLLQRYFNVESWDATSEFVKFMDEGLERIEQHFGPQAPQRQVKTKPEDIEAAREAMTAIVSERFPKLPDSAAVDVAAAAAAKLALFAEQEAAEARDCENDHGWAKGTWSFERKHALAGDLTWCWFVATKSADLSN